MSEGAPPGLADPSNDGGQDMGPGDHPEEQRVKEETTVKRERSRSRGRKRRRSRSRSRRRRRRRR